LEELYMKKDRPLTREQRALVESHLSTVHWTLRRYIRINEHICGLGYDDLYQEGCVALCHAAASYDFREEVQFHSFAKHVIHNHLLDYCRRIQTQQKNAPTTSLEELESKQPLKAKPVHDDPDRLFAQDLLNYGKRTYSGIARLGVEALELKAAGYSGTDIARLYGVQPNHVGAWISRAIQKFKKDSFLVENGEANS